jgi:hypothetical protein
VAGGLWAVLFQIDKKNWIVGTPRYKPLNHDKWYSLNIPGFFLSIFQFIMTLIDCIVYAAGPDALAASSSPKKLKFGGSTPLTALEPGSAANTYLCSLRCLGTRHKDVWQAFLNLALDETPL